MIQFTDVAKKKILALLEAEKRPEMALRVSTRGRGPGGFRYDMRFVPLAERSPEDTAFDAGGFQVVLDPQSAPHLEGVNIDFVETEFEAGFKIENPNPLWSDPVASAVQRLIDDQINPAIASHGGYVTLLDVQGDRAFVQFGGGCQGCGMVDATLKQGIEVMIKDAVPQIREIVDTTDHAGGTNPYYRSSQRGESPLA